MDQAGMDFLINFNLLRSLNKLTAAIFVLVGLIAWIVPRSPKNIYKLLGLAMIPLLTGLVTMYVGYSTSSIDMMGRFSESELTARRRSRVE